MNRQYQEKKRLEQERLMEMSKAAQITSPLQYKPTQEEINELQELMQKAEETKHKPTGI
jgi:hypothetical protein